MSDKQTIYADQDKGLSDGGQPQQPVYMTSVAQPDNSPLFLKAYAGVLLFIPLGISLFLLKKILE